MMLATVDSECGGGDGGGVDVGEAVGSGLATKSVI